MNSENFEIKSSIKWANLLRNSKLVGEYKERRAVHENKWNAICYEKCRSREVTNFKSFSMFLHRPQTIQCQKYTNNTNCFYVPSSSIVFDRFLMKRFQKFDVRNDDWCIRDVFLNIMIVLFRFYGEHKN